MKIDIVSLYGYPMNNTILYTNYQNHSPHSYRQIYSQCSGNTFLSLFHNRQTYIEVPSHKKLDMQHSQKQ